MAQFENRPPSIARMPTSARPPGPAGARRHRRWNAAHVLACDGAQGQELAGLGSGSCSRSAGGWRSVIGHRAAVLARRGQRAGRWKAGERSGRAGLVRLNGQTGSRQSRAVQPCGRWSRSGTFLTVLARAFAGRQPPGRRQHVAEASDGASIAAGCRRHAAARCRSAQLHGLRVDIQSVVQAGASW